MVGRVGSRRTDNKPGQELQLCGNPLEPGIHGGKVEASVFGKLCVDLMSTIRKLSSSRGLCRFRGANGSYTRFFAKTRQPIKWADVSGVASVVFRSVSFDWRQPKHIKMTEAAGIFSISEKESIFEINVSTRTRQRRQGIILIYHLSFLLTGMYFSSSFDPQRVTGSREGKRANVGGRLRYHLDAIPSPE